MLSVWSNVWGLDNETAIYVISKWSIQTLKNSGVPRDVTDYLAESLKEGMIISSIRKTVIKKRAAQDDEFEKLRKILTSNSGEIILIDFNEWLKNFKNDLGEKRVDEHIETILKYTRRNGELSTYFPPAGSNGTHANGSELTDKMKQIIDEAADNETRQAPVVLQN